MRRTGPARRPQIPGYPVAGKTGHRPQAARTSTAVPYVASFAGFAPADDPRLAAIVVLDEPGAASIYGGEVAAPVFPQIMQFALAYERVPPTS